MATGSVPTVGTRVNLQMFASDLLAHQNLVLVESYDSSGYSSVLFSDGAGVKVAVTGDRSSLAMIMTAALAQLRPPDPDPVLPQDDPGSSLPEVEGGETA